MSAQYSYSDLKEKFDKFNLQSKASTSSAARGDSFLKNIKMAPTFLDTTLNVPRVSTLNDRRMMRVELQKEIIKREINIMKKRQARKTMAFAGSILPFRSVIRLYPQTHELETFKTITRTPSSIMIYDKFPFDDFKKIGDLMYEYRRLKKKPKTMSQVLQEISGEDGYLNGSAVSSCNIDPAFRKINKTFSAFLIWRVESSSLIAVPKEQYGIFYNEESYIIYAASAHGQPTGPQFVSKEVRGQIEYHIHFWLGHSVTADKAGAAAYKTIELDTFLGGFAVQHRESQGKETPRFHSYFINGFRVLKETEELHQFEIEQQLFQPRLYKVKGVRAPIITEMTNISWTHFNSNDIFLLHTSTIIFVWIGRATTAISRLYGTQAAIELRKEYKTHNMVFVDDGYEKTIFDYDDRVIFEQYLPLDKRIVKVDQEDEIDATTAKKQRMQHIKLYQCCEHKGKYRVTEIKTGPLQQEDLVSDDVFILDHVQSGIWVWVGKGANEKDRLDAIRNARGFVKKKKYNSNTPVTRVVDSFEPIEFKMLFNNWNEKIEPKQLGRKIPVIKVTRFDAITMLDRRALAAKSQLIDDGTGLLKVWRIKRHEAIDLPKERFGIFYNGDSYVILYSYSAIGDYNRYIIYYWMGAHSIPDEHDVMIKKSNELDATIAENKSMFVRVSQGKEPAHFLQLFKGRLRIFQGKGTDCDVSGKNMKTPKTYLLQVQGTSTYNTKGIQVPLRASSLNSNYCFILRKHNTYYIWCGTFSTGDNREMAKLYTGADFTLLLEGTEPHNFWNTLGGKKDYINVKIPEPNLLNINLHARLFKCSHFSGVFKAEEILHFVQHDLTPEDIMLLDAQTAIYIWIGSNSTMEDRRLSLEMAKEFLRDDPMGRDTKTTIIRIKQGHEPPTFTGFFDVWNEMGWNEHESYEKIRSNIQKVNIEIIQRISHGEENKFNNYNKYSISVLRSGIETLPAAVDPLNKELHLTYDDFLSLFQMAYKEFEKLPLWKRQELKKNVGLF